MIETIAVIGDSGSVGFGTRGRGYPIVLAELLGSEAPVVAAEFGKTSADALLDVGEVLGGRPDVVVVQTGMADGLVHPGRWTQRFLERFAPAEWHGVDGLERRAVFDRSRSVRLRQKLVAGTKTNLKRAIILTTGGWTRMQPDDSARCLDTMLTELESSGALVVYVDIYRTDERMFPRQARTHARFRATRDVVVARHPAVVVVDPDEVLDCWDSYLGDHGHWNASGHEQVAHLIHRCVEQHRGAPQASGAGGDPVDGGRPDPLATLR